MTGIYSETLCREMELYSDFAKQDSLHTVYFGGGTPSRMQPDEIISILQKADATFGLSQVSETTLECNPDDITPQFLKSVSQSGINRISLGVQTLNDRMLLAIHRRHTASQAISAIRLCQEYGFTNISMDLIYGLPGQTVEDFRKDMEQAVKLGVTHISAYCLTYEEGTPLQKMLLQNKITAVPDDVCADMYTELCRTLADSGFIHYETSNFCLPGYHSRHNSSYWNGTRYLGIGSGAHSFDGNIRRWNIADIDKYISGIRNGHPEYGYEELSDTDKYNELIMLSLRTSAGLSLTVMRKRFGQDLAESFLDAADRWIRKGSLIRIGDNVRMSESAMFTGDGIVSSLFRDQ